MYRLLKAGKVIANIKASLLTAEYVENLIKNGYIISGDYTKGV